MQSQAEECGAEAVMRLNMANMLDRAVASMPIFMIMVAGALTKMGYFSWGLAWIAGLCAPAIIADLLNSRQNHAEI
jgi:hypothetical protein